MKHLKLILPFCCILVLAGTMAFRPLVSTSPGKTLYLVRHAKATHESPHLRDYDRMLTAEGLEEARLMGAFLSQNMTGIDLVLSSPAPRALQTAHILARAVGYDSLAVQVDSLLYACSPETLLSTIRQLDNSYASAMVVAHNPAIASLAAFLQTQTSLAEVPPGAVMAIHFETGSWSEIGPEKARFVFFRTPAELKP